ncbi:MAG: hypothetical protein JWO14_1638 [Solirubrobacterales bacterium]|nr:hypothetical protein [Solirubrobacterales bacterium]
MGTTPSLAPDELEVQELIRLSEILEQGSSSLNQRATTLAALTVTALGAFGVFAGKIHELHGGITKAFVAVALVDASLALVLSAGIGLLAVAPGSDWREKFEAESRPILAGRLDKRVETLRERVTKQTERNSWKANRMKVSYLLTSVALVAAAAAVVAVAISEGF